MSFIIPKLAFYVVLCYDNIMNEPMPPAVDPQDLLGSFRDTVQGDDDTGHDYADTDLEDGLDYPEPVFQIVDPNEVRLNYNIFKKRQSDTPITLRVLGAEYVESLLSLDSLQSHGVDISSFTKLSERKFADAVRQIKSILGSPSVETVPISYYSELPESIRGLLQPAANTRQLLEQIVTAEPEVIRDFLVWNTSHIAALSAEHQPLFEQMKQRFTETMLEAIKRGLPVSEHQLLTRLDDSSMHLTDPLVDSFDSLLGRFNGQDRTVHISASYEHLGVPIYDTACHELLHLVSGATIEQSVEPDLPDLTMTDVTRCGIADKEGKEAPDWLNEAINEQLMALLLRPDMPADFSSLNTRADFFGVSNGASTVRTLYDNMAGSYRSNRIALFALLGDGAPIYSMIGAHFEDTMPDSSLPHTEKFWDYLENQYGRGIHEHIASFGINMSAKDLEKFLDGLKQMYIIQQLSVHSLFLDKP